jgi:hypothetical protein
MTDIRVLPENDKTNGWNRILPPRSPQPPLRGEQRADWAVVGAALPLPLAQGGASAGGEPAAGSHRPAGGP